MLNILQVSSFNINKFNQRPIQSKRNNNYITIPGFTPKYNKNLNADTVSFKGSPAVSIENIRAFVKNSSERLEPRFNFSEKGIDEIVSKITLKSLPFLSDLLEIADKKLPSKGISMLLEYLNKEETDVEEFKEKLENFKNLKEILTGRGFTKSILTDYLNLIPSQGIIDLLKSDILLEQPKYDDFNSLQAVYNYAVKYFNENLKKMQDPDPEYKAKIMMKDGIFSSILALGQVYDKSALNELFYNRGKYIQTIYMPRFRQLNEEDLVNLRRVQTSAVTDKENKGGNYATYEVSLDDKIWTLNFLSINREIANNGEKALNFNDYIKPVNEYNPDANFIIKFQKMKLALMDKVLKHIGIPEKVVDKYISDWKTAYAEDQTLAKRRKDFWDINYAHLLNAPEGSLLRKIIVSDTIGEFKKLLFEKGEIAATNKLNEEAFTKNKLDYQKWLKPSIKPITRKFTDSTGLKIKSFTVKNWDRCAKESLFDGNYTTCCTGIDKDQGASFPVYLTNTATTTLEVRTEKNKVIAMSRILMAKVNGKLSMIVENIEVNNKMVKHYLYNDETKYKFREMIFDYVRAFAKDINKNEEDLPVYFCSNYYKVKGIEKGLETGKRYEDVELVGEFPDHIYINAYGGRVDHAKLQFADDGDGFALHLSDISKKAKPIIDDSSIEVTESGYNYGDTRYFEP